MGEGSQAADHPISALSYHEAIARHAGPLTVHAVFSRAVHLRTADGTILTITDSRWNGPLTVRVAGKEIVGCAFTVGAPARLTAERLEVGPHTVMLPAASAWSAASAHLPLGTVWLEHDARALRAALRTAGRGGLAAWREDERASDPAWLRRGRRELAPLSEALARFDLPVLVNAASGLLGLGPGLTPSGDDVLCGLLAALSVFAARSPRHRGRCEEAGAALTGRILADAPERTTSFSGTLLRWAARGVVAEPLLCLLQAVGSPLPHQSIEEVLILGHSSGSDMLTGVLPACAAVTRWEEVLGSSVDRSREYLSRLH